MTRHAIPAAWYKTRPEPPDDPALRQTTIVVATLHMTPSRHQEAEAHFAEAFGHPCCMVTLQHAATHWPVGDLIDWMATCTPL
jgi:hypothetical protein